MGPIYALGLTHKWSPAQFDCPFFEDVIDRWVSKCFCLKLETRKKSKKRIKQKQNKNPFLLQTNTCSQGTWEYQIGPRSHADLSKSSLTIICKIVHLSFQINFNLTQGFHWNPQMTANWLDPICCCRHTGGGQACSHIPCSPAKTRLLPQLKWPFLF